MEKFLNKDIYFWPYPFYVTYTQYKLELEESFQEIMFQNHTDFRHALMSMADQLSKYLFMAFDCYSEIKMLLKTQFTDSLFADIYSENLSLF